MRLPRDVSGPELVKALRVLEIIGGAVDDLAPRAGLGALRVLKIVGAIGDVEIDVA